MGLKKKITYTIFSNWAVLLVNICVSFFLAPYIVHKLGNVYYGVWSMVMQFSGYLYLMDFGVRDSVIRYSSRLHAKQSGKLLNQVISTGLVLYSAIGLVSISIVAVGAYLFPLIFNIPSDMALEVRVVVLLTGLTIAQTFAFNVYSGVLIGLQRFYIFNIVHFFLIFVRVGMIVYLLAAGYRIVALASVQLFIGLVSGVIVIWLAKQQLRKARLPMRFFLHGKKRFYVTARKLFNYSKYVFVINIASKIIFATDTMIIGLFMNVSNVTFYAIAGNLIEYLKQLLTTSSSVFSPVTSHLDALGEKEKVQEVLCSGARFNLFVGLPVAVTYVILGREFIGLWMGPEYAIESFGVLLVLGLTQIFSFHQYSISGVIFGLGKHRTLAYWRVVEAIVNLGLSIALIKPFGIVGVALGTAIPHVLMSVIVFPLYARKITGISLGDLWQQGFLKPICAIVPFVLLAFGAKQYLYHETLLDYFLSITVISSIYLATSYYVILKKNERDWLVAMIKDRLRSVRTKKDRSN